MSAFRRDNFVVEKCDINNGALILVACAIMTGLACVVLVARIYTRGWMTHSTDRDDYAMWAAVTLSVVGFAVIIPEVQNGAGRYGICLAPEELQRSLMLQYITQPLYVWAILLVKASIVFCLLRFSPSKAFSCFLWILMVFFISIASLYFITELLQCQPLKKMWDSSLNGVCFPPLAIRAAAYANDSMSLTVDLLLATLPIPMIWNLQVQMHVKVAIGFVMSLGALAAAACAIRIHYLAPDTQTGDDLFDSIPRTIWTAVECNIAIIAASVPSIIPLLKKFHALRKGVSTSSREQSHAGQQDLEHGNQKHSGAQGVILRKFTMQQGVLVDVDVDVTKRDMIPGIRIDRQESSLLGNDFNDDEDDDLSRMYANASRNISKRTTLQSSTQEAGKTFTLYSGTITIGGRWWTHGRQ